MWKTRNLTNLERQKIIQILLEKCKNGKPARGSMLEVAVQFGVTRKSITNLWNKAKQQRDAGEVINVISKLKGKKCKPRLVFDDAKFKSLDLEQKTTQARVAAAMKCSQSMVSKWVTDKVIRTHTNALKPGLTDKNKLCRLIFSMSQLYYDDICSKAMFKDQSNVIHIDEKWFYITKDGQRFYLSQTEPDPYRSVQSKTFIGKIMFMCAVGRPQYDENNDVIFDGKIGIWPFVYLEPAKRNSKNRVAGTMETKPIESITKQVVKDMLLGKVLPEIKRKWPENASKTIYIQQDNARPHINNSDADFRAAASSNGWNIQLVQQPPNSPDLNVLDLGFFRAIHHQDTQELLQGCMLEVLQLRGHNKYKIPHMHKSKLAKEGRLPQYLQADINVVKDCIRYVQNVRDESQITQITELIDSVMLGSQQ
ncbi:uncharacterized protein LOC141651013 [Silene latifolia]|uniref:uncharacterized protein LOC141651013 n=1 Tax=Silene latifolia TaxID=37657 RepID=UPI003D7877EC